MRRRMGAAALEMDAAPDMDRAPDGSGQGQWRATVAARLPSQHWPQQTVLITAVDAHTGEPVVFDRHSGVDLVDAVAASTANGFGVPPYRIDDSRYIDGGYRRNENADLAAGYERVLVLSPFGGRSRHPQEWGMHLAAQVEELRAGGSRVETIFPDGDSLTAFGDNMMDLSTRAPAARASTAKATAWPGTSPNSGAERDQLVVGPAAAGEHDGPAGGGSSIEGSVIAVLRFWVVRLSLRRVPGAACSPDAVARCGAGRRQ